MTEHEARARIQKIEEEMSKLPSGCVTCKVINGKERYYHQYYVDGKRKDKIVPAEEAEPLKTKIERYQCLKQELKELKALLPKEHRPRVKSKKVMPDVDFECQVATGEALLRMARRVAKWERRDAYEKLQDYLYSESNDRVCVIFGLRRTGKSTMLRQAIADMNADDRAKAAYIKLQSSDTMSMLDRDMKKLSRLGYQYIFIDEVTLAEEFIDTASLFSDIYATMGIKIVLSGTDSLGFWFAESEELYDRIKPNIHTTYIPFREFSRLLGIDDVDEYIRYGGTLRVGELAFDDQDANAEDASFRDDESTRRYIDTAICENIQHSLKCYESGRHFRHLQDLYDKNELTNAINRIIEDMNHRFVLNVLERDFRSGDLALARKNILRGKNSEQHGRVLDQIDTKTVTERLMEILKIRNKQSLTVPLTETHAYEIEEYLKALELIDYCPIMTTEPSKNGEDKRNVLFLQPGMRYCQAQALVHVLLKDEYFQQLDEREKTYIQDRILEGVRGRMLEDIILIETAKALNSSRYKVFKLQFDRGEFDMVVYDKQEHCCDVYEIKHSDKMVYDQTKHLIDEEKIALTERRFGEVRGKFVLYRGEMKENESGILYQNASDYLNGLPDTAITEDIEEDIGEDIEQDIDEEDQGWKLEM